MIWKEKKKFSLPTAALPTEVSKKFAILKSKKQKDAALKWMWP